MARQYIKLRAKPTQRPREDLWPYIDWFIENMDADKIVEVGKHSSDGIGFAEMLEYLKQKHPDLKWSSSWSTEANELLNQWEGSIEQDSETSLEIDYPGGPEEIQEATITLSHQAFWPVKDIIVDEDTHRLRWEIGNDAESIAADTLYPNPTVHSAEVFARGVQDSQAAMIRIELVWARTFEPDDIDDEETVKPELEDLESFLQELAEISGWLASPNAAPDDAGFDYNGFHEEVQEKLEALGVYRDLAGEIDAEEERDLPGQLGLPGIDAPRAMTPEQKAEEEHYLDQIYATTVPAVRREYQRRLDALRRSLELPLQESRIIQRWSTIIK